MLTRRLFRLSLLLCAAAAPLLLSPETVCAETPGVQSMARGDYARAFKELMQAAKSGDPQAQLDLGRAYLDGKGTAADPVQAFKWIAQAAAKGLPEAEYELGVLYDDGTGTKAQPAQAAEWYQKAVAHDYLPAYHALGELYRLGTGVARDEAQALKLYRTAADRNDIDSQLELGRMVRDGIGLPQNDNEATVWFRKAASLGSPEARYLLALMLLKGQTPEGIGHAPSAKVEEAMRWLEEAAALNHGPSLYYLGMVTLRGINRSYNVGQAISYLLRAADQGEAMAALKVGQLYQDGKLVAADPVQAYSYYVIADELGEERARVLRDSVGQSLTAPQQQLARKRAQEWLNIRGF